MRRQSYNMKTFSCIITLFCIHFASSAFISMKYVVPEPTIEVYTKGFQVRIPHEEGIHLFAFHGNINREMDNLEAGQFSKDILRKKGDEWVFEDRRTKLVKGDTIYYWLFVIKDNLGYRFDDGVFTVKDITPLPESIDNETYDPIPKGQEGTHQDNDKKETAKTDAMCVLLKNLTDKLDSLKKQTAVSEEVIDILKYLVAKNDTSRTLRLEGTLPADDDARYVAQMIVKEKLGTTIQIADASWDDQKKHIEFEVRNIDDKILLIRKAKEKLLRSKIKLVY